MYILSFINSILAYIRFIRDLKYYFTVKNYKTDHGFNLWLQNKPKNKYLVDKVETDIIKKYINKVEIFLDIGANIGFFTVFSKLKNKKLITYSIEPHPFNFKILKKNISQFKFKNSHILNFAISDKNQSQKLYGHGQGASLINNWGGIKTLHRTVAAKTLDTVFSYKLKNYKNLFIKIDVEGKEYEVLKGSDNILNKKCVIMFENGVKKNFVNKNKNFMKIFKLLISNKYKIYNLGNLNKKLDIKALKKIYNMEKELNNINYLAIK